MSHTGQSRRLSDVRAMSASLRLRTYRCGAANRRDGPTAGASNFSLKFQKQMVGLRRERRLLEQGAVVRSRF